MSFIATSLWVLVQLILQKNGSSSNINLKINNDSNDIIKEDWNTIIYIGIAAIKRARKNNSNCLLPTMTVLVSTFRPNIFCCTFHQLREYLLKYIRSTHFIPSCSQVNPLTAGDTHMYHSFLSLILLLHPHLSKTHRRWTYSDIRGLPR